MNLSFSRKNTSVTMNDYKNALSPCSLFSWQLHSDIIFRETFAFCLQFLLTYHCPSQNYISCYLFCFFVQLVSTAHEYICFEQLSSKFKWDIHQKLHNFTLTSRYLLCFYTQRVKHFLLCMSPVMTYFRLRNKNKVSVKITKCQKWEFRNTQEKDHYSFAVALFSSYQSNCINSCYQHRWWLE